MSMISAAVVICEWR